MTVVVARVFDPYADLTPRRLLLTQTRSRAILLGRFDFASPLLFFDYKPARFKEDDKINTFTNMFLAETTFLA